MNDPQTRLPASLTPRRTASHDEPADDNAPREAASHEPADEKYDTSRMPCTD